MTSWFNSNKELKKLAAMLVEHVDNNMLTNTVQVLKSLNYQQVLDIDAGCYKSCWVGLTQEQEEKINLDPILCEKLYRQHVMTYTHTLSRDRNPNNRIRTITEDDVLCLLIGNAWDLRFLLKFLLVTPQVYVMFAQQVYTDEHPRLVDYMLNYIYERKIGRELRDKRC